MGGFSAWHWIIVALVVLVLFGRGKISETMGDFGKGIKSFKKGLGEEETRPQQQTPPPPAPQISPPASAPSEQSASQTVQSGNPSNTE